MLKEHKRIAIELGEVPADRVIVPDNGSIIEISGKDEAKLLKEKVPAYPIMVDGFSVSDMKAAVLADRKVLAKEGFINIIVLINISKRKLQKSPDVLSRGFVYLRESTALISSIRLLVTKLAEDEIKNSAKYGGKINIDKLKEQIYERLEILILKKTNKRPVIMPVVLVVEI